MGSLYGFRVHYFQRKVDELVINMEQEALKLVEVLNIDNSDRGTESGNSETSEVNNG